MSDYGKKYVDVTPLLDLFEAQEGEVEHIIGKTGNGKTYYATYRALKYLFSGYTVYTTWRLNIPDYYDEREHWWPVIRNLFLFRSDFFRFDLKNNWHYLDLDQYLDEKSGAVDTKRVAAFIATLTDCILMMDEGQDVFDSHEKAGKAARQTITRMRHLHKTLIIISQRAQAVDVTARGNVSHFYKCVKTWGWPRAFFKVYTTDEIDEANNYPIWVRHDSTGRETWKAPVYYSGWAKQYVYDAYDSWYLRRAMQRSQEIRLDAYRLGGGDRFKAFWAMFRRKKLSTLPNKKSEVAVKSATIAPWPSGEKNSGGAGYLLDLKTALKD